MGYMRESFDLIDDKLKNAVEGPKGNKDDDDECLIFWAEASWNWLRLSPTGMTRLNSTGKRHNILN